MTTHTDTKRERPRHHDAQDLEVLKSLLSRHPDFPREGVVFWDILPIFRNPLALETLFNHLVSHIDESSYGRPDVIVGLDSRGFLLGPTMAMRLKASFVPVRKKGKLPGKVKTASYEKEYGSDDLEIQTNAIKPKDRVIIIDDLIATGGTINAAVTLVEHLGGVVLESMAVIELDDLAGRTNIKGPVWSLLHIGIVSE